MLGVHQDGDQDGAEDREPVMPEETRGADRTMEEALSDGCFAHRFSMAECPVRYDANERWAWLLGWRLQEHLTKARLEDEAAK